MRRIILAMFLSALLLAASACSSSPPAGDSPVDSAPSTDQQEPSSQQSEVESEPVVGPASRDNSSAELTTLFAGEFVVGDDIPHGRYVVTGDGTGNLFVYKNDLPVVNEVLDTSMGIGVPSVTIDLDDGQKIEISGLSEVVFTPAETVMQETLSTGTWVVGIDIASGKYDATCSDGDSGNLFVYSNGIPSTNEILDKSGMGIGVEKVRVTLVDGQEIHISGLSEVQFIPA